MSSRDRSATCPFRRTARFAFASSCSCSVRLSRSSWSQDREETVRSRSYNLRRCCCSWCSSVAPGQSLVGWKRFVRWIVWFMRSSGSWNRPERGLCRESLDSLLQWYPSFGAWEQNALANHHSDWCPLSSTSSEPFYCSLDHQRIDWVWPHFDVFTRPELLISLWFSDRNLSRESDPWPCQKIGWVRLPGGAGHDTLLAEGSAAACLGSDATFSPFWTKWTVLWPFCSAPTSLVGRSHRLEAIGLTVFSALLSGFWTADLVSGILVSRFCQGFHLDVTHRCRRVVHRHPDAGSP